MSTVESSSGFAADADYFRALERERTQALVARNMRWEPQDIEVRLSSGMAIVRYKASLQFPSGNVVVCWHTDSYEPREGHWQAVWSQATAIPQSANTSGG